jgi:hypothetical protein
VGRDVLRDPGLDQGNRKGIQVNVSMPQHQGGRMKKLEKIEE